VHQLLRDDLKVKRAIVERFGQGVVAPDGEIDRAAVGRIVFMDRAELAWLEQLLHPLVSAAYLLWRRRLGELPDPPPVCVAEVPLLYESGGESHFDVVVAITASPAVRSARAIRPDMGLREQRLIPDVEKLARADFAYVNDGTLEELDAFVAGVMAKLTEQ
jgi:dephospho-CoA kinase